MAAVNKQDSNTTSLSYAKEARIGFLPGEAGNAGVPDWKTLDPSEYNDFGATLTTVTPETFNESRQRSKGSISDLEAAGGFGHYMTFNNLQELMEGFMFADIRRKARVAATEVSGSTYSIPSTTGFQVGSIVSGTDFAVSTNNGIGVVETVVADTSIAVGAGQAATEATPPSSSYLDVVGFQADADDLDVDASGDLPVLTSTTLDFTTLGLVPGQWIFIGGDDSAHSFANSENNGYKRIRSVAANALTIDKSNTSMISEVTTTETVRLFFGDVLRNEPKSLIKRSSFQFERTVGAPDDSSTDEQSEVIRGAVANEFELQVPTAELLKCSLGFIAIDKEDREASEGLKQTSVTSFPPSEEVNTSSDVPRINLSIVSHTDENPTPLFTYVTEASLTINNNVKLLKAVGVLGGFDMSAGIFQVSGELTAYFTTVAALKSVRNNASVSLDMSFFKNNQAFVFDLPLLSTSTAGLNIEINEAITLPLTTEAASGEDVDPNLDHTLLITYFNYLPDAAE